MRSDQDRPAGTQAKLFELLREVSQRDDLLKLKFAYRKRGLDALMQSGEADVEEVEG